MTCHRHGPQQLLPIRWRGIRHFGARLRHKILHDDFLNVPILLMQRSQSQQAVKPFAAGFPYADQDAARKRYASFTGRADGIQAN